MMMKKKNENDELNKMLLSFVESVKFNFCCVLFWRISEGNNLMWKKSFEIYFFFDVQTSA